MRYGHGALRNKIAFLCLAFLLLAGAVPSFAATETEEADEEAAIRGERDFFLAEGGDPLADERKKDPSVNGESEDPPVYIPPGDALPKVTARTL